MKDKMKTQIVMLPTIMGDQPRFAPSGWEFDKTAIIAWCKLMHEAKEINLMKRGAKRHLMRDLDRAMVKAKCLSQVLASSIGMSDFYWIEAAKDLCEEHVGG